MQREPQLLDVVALTADLPDQHLSRGQVGTIVEVWKPGQATGQNPGKTSGKTPGVFEVEFCDHDGRTYAMAAVRADQLLVLHYEPAEAA